MPALSLTSEVTRSAVTDASGGTAVVLELSTTRFTVRNTGPNTAWLGLVTGVTDATGFPIPSGESHTFDKEAAVPLSLFFVCTAAETAGVAIIEEK